MQISRRAAIIGAGATAIVKPKIVRAADAAWAVTLDGSAALKNTSPGQLGFPETSSKVTATLCYRAASPPPLSAPTVNFLTVETSGVSSIPLFQISIGNNDGAGNVGLEAAMIQNPNSGVEYACANGKIPCDANYWHQIVVSMDSAAPAKAMMLDGVLVPDIAPSGTAFTQNWGGAAEVWVGGFGHNGSNFIGDIAQVWMAVGVAADLNDRKVAGRFWNYRLGMPQKFSGAGAEVISANPEIFPQICLTGPASIFNRNGGRAHWTLWSRTDQAPFSYAGNVTTAQSDPWEEAIGVAVRRG